MVKAKHGRDSTAKKRAGTSWVVHAMWREPAPHRDPGKTAWAEYAIPEQGMIFDEELVARAEFEAKVARLSAKAGCDGRLVTLTRRGWDENGAWIGPGQIVAEKDLDPPYGGETPGAIVGELRRKLAGQQSLELDNARELPAERELSPEQLEEIQQRQAEEAAKLEAQMTPEERAKAQAAIDERRREPDGKE